MPGSYATRDWYDTGQKAAAKLALQTRYRGYPTAIYLVTPKKEYGPTRGPERVPPNYGQPGKGIQYLFGKGSGGPFTVWPLKRIPRK